MSLYEIRVCGQLDQHWSDWLEGLTILRDTSKTTLLRGALVDDAALQGVLIKLHNLNLLLISVRRLDMETESDESESNKAESDPDSAASDDE